MSAHGSPDLGKFDPVDLTVVSDEQRSTHST